MECWECKKYERYVLACRSFSQPLNDWDVSNVTNMEHMFSQAEKYDKILNNWNITNVTNMKNMFLDCTGLKKIFKNYVKDPNIDNWLKLWYNGKATKGAVK